MFERGLIWSGKNFTYKPLLYLSLSGLQTMGLLMNIYIEADVVFHVQATPAI